MSFNLIFRRLVVLVVLVMTPHLVAAQAPNEAQLREIMKKMQNMEKPSDAQMEAIIGQAAGMQACMQEADPAAIQALSHDGEAAMNEVQDLCAAGQRDKAQDHAIEFSKRVAASPELKLVAKCSKGMSGLLPQMAALSQQQPDSAQSHVCDSQ